MKYLFTVRKPPFKEVSLDTWLAVDIPDMDPVALRVANELQKANGKPLFGERESQYVTAMSLRAKYNNDIVPNIYLVNVEEELEAEEFDAFLKAKEKLGELQEFLEKARVFSI